MRCVLARVVTSFSRNGDTTIVGRVDGGLKGRIDASWADSVGKHPLRHRCTRKVR